MRIVSLIPSGTEMLHALGLGRYQVGRSHECDFPACVRSLPACTRADLPVDVASGEIDRLVKDRARRALSIYHVFASQIAELQPTHIVTQTQCDVCAVSLDDVHAALRGEFAADAQILALTAADLNGIWNDIEIVAAGCGVNRAGWELKHSLRRRIEQIASRAGAAERKPRVACLEWLDPVMSAGNWVPELLSHVNAHCLFAEAGHHSPYMTWQELAAADPDLIVALPCGFDIERTRAEMMPFAQNEQWRNLRAARHGHVVLADWNQYMNRPGPRIVESLLIFAEICHPEIFPPSLEGAGWQRLPAGC